MLCRKCETAIQATAKESTSYQKDSRLNIVPLHTSLHILYQSIKAGCFVCRWAWARLIRGRFLPSHEPIFLEDPTESIPPSIEEFRSKFAGLADEYTNGVSAFNLHRLGRYTIPAATHLAIIWSIQHTLLPFARYNKGSFLYCKTIATRDWYDEIFRRCGIWIRLDKYLGSKEGPSGSLMVSFEGGYLSKLELWPVSPDTLGTINALHTKLKVPSASTADATRLWRYWFNTCAENHTVCRAAQQHMQSFRPTRLVQLVQDGQGVISTWRLDCKSDCRSTTDAANASSAMPYLTLSHRWGSSQPVRLMRENFLDFQEPSPIADLPKTYQHALYIAQSLGFWYIWIDSLCIIQNIEDDWRAESVLMGKIYGNAACNIAASWATGGFQGCFSVSDPVAKTPTFISPKRLRRDSPAQYQIAQASSYEVEIQQAPLNKRGWVVQERYLARRQLSFAKRQTYWECRQLVASEEFPVGLPQSLAPSKPHLEFEEGTDMRRVWVELVGLYSSCDLSRKTDKLVALSGLVKRLRNITNDKYLSGLWRKDLYQQLCWETYDHRSGKVDQNTIPRFIAPTWSWANIDGRVMYDKAYCEIAHDTLIPWVRVMESSANKLVLRSLCFWGFVGTVGPGERNEQVEVQLIDKTQSFPPLDPLAIRICWDKRLVSPRRDPAELSTVRAQRSSELLFLIVRSEGAGTYLGKVHRGLVLRRPHCSKAGGKEYVRMGIWYKFYSKVSTFCAEVAARLEISTEDHYQMEEHLDDPRIADIVHTVTVV